MKCVRRFLSFRKSGMVQSGLDGKPRDELGPNLGAAGQHLLGRDFFLLTLRICLSTAPKPKTSALRCEAFHRTSLMNHPKKEDTVIV